MPGYILHHTAAKLYFEKMKNLYDKSFTDQEKNDFFIGNLAPDTVRDKSKTHFWNPEIMNQFMRYPDLNLFLNKYNRFMNQLSCRGYLFHLYLDRVFLSEYVPSVVSFLDQEQREVEGIEEVVKVRLKKSGKILDVKEYLSDQYYYGDYTKMNAWLIKQYGVSLDMELSVENPGISEVEFHNVKNIINQLQSYMNVKEEEAESLTVFTKEGIVNFLNTAVEGFIPFTGPVVPGITGPHT